MNAGLDSSIPIERIYFERPRNKIAVDLAANVVLDSIDERLTATSQSCFVVVELQILRHQLLLSAKDSRSSAANAANNYITNIP